MAETNPPQNPLGLAVPKKAGRTIVEQGAVFTCPLLGTDKFLRFCKDRGLALNRERLLRFERLGLFAPVFRVRTPKTRVSHFRIPVNDDNNWFNKRLAFDTTSVPHARPVPDAFDETQEGYYSIFQVDDLSIILSSMTLNVHLDSYLENNDAPLSFHQQEDQWREIAQMDATSIRASGHRRALALLCQQISNRYYPQTQGDMRTINIGKSTQWDQWVSVNPQNWDWYEEVRHWQPEKIEKLYKLTPEKLRNAFECLAVAQKFYDPLEDWYQLIQFISPSERKRLKRDALLAETIRSGAQMLGLLYKDLYRGELPHPNEVTGTIVRHIPELDSRKDVRRHLEFVANRFGVNPQPKLCLIVEGSSEEATILKLFHSCFGIHPGTLGIEIVVLGGVNVATGGKKEDRFRAIFRLMDYLHHHQTITILVLDNENYATRLKTEAKKAKSIHSDRRYVTRADYIHIWKHSFEFDNFSATEIAAALTLAAEGHAAFTVSDVSAIKQSVNLGSTLNKLYRMRTNYDLPKLTLNQFLVDGMLSPNSRRNIEARPIIKILNRIHRLAALNPFPTTQEVWERNQKSKYLGSLHHAEEK